MSKRFLAIYDDKNNTYLNNCFSTNNLEMIKKFDTLNIECSIVEIYTNIFIIVLISIILSIIIAVMTNMIFPIMVTFIFMGMFILLSI